MLDLPPIAYTACRLRIGAEQTAGNLTAARANVLFAILDATQIDGYEPSVAQIAKQARCCKRTAQYARADGERLGLLYVKPQFEPHDGRMWQIPNAYEVVVPDTPVVPKPRKPGGCKPCTPRKQVYRKQEAQEGFGGVLDLLAMRRAAFAAQQRARYG